MPTPRHSEGGAHLIGSVPLADAETVFRTVTAALGPYLRRLPDGETGERRRWIYFQRTMLERHPAMEIDPTIPPYALYQWDGKLLREIPLLRFRAGIDPQTVVFETGYAQAVRTSYAVFQRLQRHGVIPAGIRFQVCLPTPMASAYMYVSPTITTVTATVPASRLRKPWCRPSGSQQSAAGGGVTHNGSQVYSTATVLLSSSCASSSDQRLVNSASLAEATSIRGLGL